VKKASSKYFEWGFGFAEIADFPFGFHRILRGSLFLTANVINLKQQDTCKLLFANFFLKNQAFTLCLILNFNQNVKSFATTLILDTAFIRDLRSPIYRLVRRFFGDNLRSTEGTSSKTMQERLSRDLSDESDRQVYLHLKFLRKLQVFDHFQKIFPSLRFSFFKAVIWLRLIPKTIPNHHYQKKPLPTFWGEKKLGKKSK